jgi:hypothetical protein
MADLEEKFNFIPEIDYNKTVAKQQIVFKKTARDKFRRIFIFICALIFVIIITMATYYSLLADSYTVLIIEPLLITWLILSYVYTNKTIKVEGISPVINKEDAIKSLKYFYNDLTFDVSQDNILRDFRFSSFLKAGRIITVLFHGNDVYFHKTILGKGNSIYTISGPIDYLKTKEIAEYFLWLKIKRQKEPLEH